MWACATIAPRRGGAAATAAHANAAACARVLCALPHRADLTARNPRGEGAAFVAAKCVIVVVAVVVAVAPQEKTTVVTPVARKVNVVGTGRSRV